MIRDTLNTLIYNLESITEVLDLAQLFPDPQPLEIELGAGDGSFLIDYATIHSQRNFIGIERLLGRLSKIDRRAQRAGLANLRCIRIESSYFLEYLLPPNSAAALHIYFPDPWPKRKHRRHRLINEGFPTLASRALQPAARVYLRTDDQEYFEQMVTVFGASSLFHPVETPAEILSLPTDFERGFNERGVATLHAAYEKQNVASR